MRDDEIEPTRIQRAFAEIAKEGVAEAELERAPEDLPSKPPVWRTRLADICAVGLGGSLGAPSRYWLGRWATAQWGSAFPWGTLLINLTGSFVLGLFLTYVMERHPTRAAPRLYFATGFLGAYTTFSTFSYETVRLIQHGHVSRAVIYVAASLVGGLIAAGAGIALAARR
jgi:CrcB protein